jgi:hypothetical protein
MNRVVLAAVGVAVLAVGAGGGWYLYQRYLDDRDKQNCFSGADPDACFRQAIIAFKRGQISEEDRLMTQHCAQREGLESGRSDITMVAACIVSLRGRVEAAAALK